MIYVYLFLGMIMNWCYSICGNYGIAIVIFTFITKILLLPLSLWTYFNSITMVKIQPDINYIKVKYYGQKDLIAEEEAKLYKEKKYYPLLSVIPTIVQLFLLMGVVDVIRQGISNPAIDMMIGNINLGAEPEKVGVSLIWSPIVAGLAAYILCIAQNKSNVLQAEQTNSNKWAMTIFSVGLSLYLGWFVAVGTAFYWVCSNLMAVLQMYICNWIIRPRRFIDYEKLEESRKQLADLQDVGAKKKELFFSERRRKERTDYKRFFSVANKHLVFYSESNGFYKYFKGYIEYLLENTNIIIHYITSDFEDQIFEMEKTNPQIRAYYIGENKLITMMMKMDADIVCMTMPDLDNYHIKRSYIRDDIEYIYIDHGMDSVNLTTRKGSRDHFDTIFCSGPHRKQEIEASEIVYGLKKKKLLEIGYPLLDEMKKEYDLHDHKLNERKKILIAPSWQKDNIIDNCLEDILSQLIDKDYQIIVRPHPQHVRHERGYLERMSRKYEKYGIIFQIDFSSDNPVMESDVLITDWSAISMEFAFTTLQPVLFINTPMKIMNPDYKDIDIIPINIEMRNKIGISVDLNEISKVGEYVDELIVNKEKYQDTIYDWMLSRTYNLGKSSEIGALYIVQSLQDKIKERGRK